MAFRGHNGDVKKGTATVGVQRQYSGTAGRIENSQVAVYLTYAAPGGHALIDRALYLARSWAKDLQRCADAGIPTNQRSFATKPTLATALITRAVEAKVPATWVAGDEGLWIGAAIRRHGLGHALAVSANRRVPTHAGSIRVDRLTAQLPKGAWQKHSAGSGAHTGTATTWAWIELLAEDQTDTGHHHLLIRRNDRTGELAYLRCDSPRPFALHTLVAVAGQRWRIEESFQAAKGLNRARSTPGPSLDLLASLDHPHTHS
jgi:SRSO17 transposase